VWSLHLHVFSLLCTCHPRPNFNWLERDVAGSLKFLIVASQRIFYFLSNFYIIPIQRTKLLSFCAMAQTTFLLELILGTSFVNLKLLNVWKQKSVAALCNSAFGKTLLTVILRTTRLLYCMYLICICMKGNLFEFECIHSRVNAPILECERSLEAY